MSSSSYESLILEPWRWPKVSKLCRVRGSTSLFPHLHPYLQETRNLLSIDACPRTRCHLQGQEEARPFLQQQG